MAMRGKQKGSIFVLKKWAPTEERELLKKRKLSEALLNESREESQHRLYEVRSKSTILTRGFSRWT